MSAPVPPDWLVSRAAALLGGPLGDWTRVDSGYTRAERWRAVTRPGRRVFVKAAGVPEVREALRQEGRVYASVRGPFLPELVAFDDPGGAEGVPLLVLADLGLARWPPPWREGDVRRVLDALDAAHAACVPDGVRDATVAMAEEFRGWSRVAADPRPFLSLGLASSAWTERALPTLVRAASEAVLGGPALLHQDVRSDNLCFDGSRALLVDWSWVVRGNPLLDAAFWAPSLAFEGGPPPEETVGHQPALAAGVSGFFASVAGLPPDPPPRRVRTLQRNQLLHALPWAARALGLPPPASDL